MWTSENALLPHAEEELWPISSASDKQPAAG